MISILRKLRAVGELLIAYAVMRADVEAVTTEPAVREAWDRFCSDPAVLTIVPRISAEWRAVEQAINHMK